VFVIGWNVDIYDGIQPNGAGNYRLAANSPCIDTGTNYSWMLDAVDVRSKDMDGRMRVQIREGGHGRL